MAGGLRGGTWLATVRSSDKEKDYIWYDALFDLQERSGRLSEFVVLL
jgi:hypothetical protein